MIKTPTVLIVGAGATAEYGFPLGAALVKQIDFNTRDPGTALGKALLEVGVSPMAVGAFNSRLVGSDSDSIDVFLESNTEEFVRIGKSAIAHVILLAESGCLKQRRLIGAPPDDHWLKYIWNAARAGSDARTLADNRVSFVTFNYDRVLETYLDGVIRSTFDLGPTQTAMLREQALPIVHLHGQVSGVAFGAVEDALSGTRLEALAAGIRIVHDPVPVNDAAFDAAREMVRQAELVCCLGFGYHPTNIGRLQLHESIRSGARFLGSTYHMGDAEVRQAQNALNLALARGTSDLKCEAFLRECVELV